MTGTEHAILTDFREEMREELSSIRAEFREQIITTRAELAPAVRLAANVAVLGRALAASGRFIKWGAGVGSGLGGLLVVLKAFGVL